MTGSLSRGAAAFSGFLAVLMLLWAAGPAAAQGTVKGTYQDWQVSCDRPAGASSDQCALIQSVQDDERDNVALQILVLKTADKKARILRVLAPLGVLLPSGLGLKIDDVDIGRTGFVRCLPTACVAEVLLDDTLLSKLRSGKQALFVIFVTPEEGIGVPVSLAGFGPGYDALP